MARLILSSPAESDLQAAWSHVARHNLNAADRIIDRFGDVFRQLEAFPMLGEIQPHPVNELRRITAAPYVIVYQVTAIDIIIVRIFHASQRWEDLL